MNRELSPDASRMAVEEAFARYAKTAWARACACHLGSVCGPACQQGQHHDGCPKAPAARESVQFRTDEESRETPSGRAAGGSPANFPESAPVIDKGRHTDYCNCESCLKDRSAL